MRFESKDPKDFNPCLSPGTYDAEVVKAEEKQSKNGNEMIALTLRVFHEDETVLVNDWLVSMDSMIPKIYSFCASAGILDEYHNGELTAELCKGQNVQVKLTVEANAQYGDQNKVKGYVFENNPIDNPADAYEPPQGVPASTTIAANKAAAEAAYRGEDPDIPFAPNVI